MELLHAVLHLGIDMGYREKIPCYVRSYCILLTWIWGIFFHERSHQWFSARLQYLQCISNVDTAAMYQTIQYEIIQLFLLIYSQSGRHHNVKLSSYRFWNSQNKDKMVSQLSCLYNGNLHTRTDCLCIEKGHWWAEHGSDLSDIGTLCFLIHGGLNKLSSICLTGNLYIFIQFWFVSLVPVATSQH